VRKQLRQVIEIKELKLKAKNISCSEIFTALLMNIKILCDVTLYLLAIGYQRFEKKNHSSLFRAVRKEFFLNMNGCFIYLKSWFGDGFHAPSRESHLLMRDTLRTL